MEKKKAWIWFPGAPYTQESACRAARKSLLPKGWSIVEGPNEDSKVYQLYFADYDQLPFEQLHPAVYQKDVASTSTTQLPQLSSYSIRKSLIRKNYLANSLHLANVKKGSSSQHQDVRRVHLSDHGDDVRIIPKTWVFEVTNADDLDELLTDELYDMREELEENQNRKTETRKWFILKPAMADRGMGIRLLDSVETLQIIFEEFEENEEEEDEEEVEEEDDRRTSIVTSQLRHFIIQEYLDQPFLIQPSGLKGAHKFHIRAYVLAQGSLRVFLYDDMLALFAPTPYQRPEGKVDLTSHLTNTCLQSEVEETVHLLRDLIGCKYYYANGEEMGSITQAMMDTIHRQTSGVIAETFQACANADRINFQPWPYAWEIFGVDLMVEIRQQEDPSLVKNKESELEIKVWLLEVNAQPDFARTGDKLQCIIDRLFEQVLAITLKDEENDCEEWQVGTSREGMTLCLDMPLSAGGW